MGRGVKGVTRHGVRCVSCLKDQELGHVLWFLHASALLSVVGTPGKCP